MLGSVRFDTTPRFTQSAYDTPPTLAVPAASPRDEARQDNTELAAAWRLDQTALVADALRSVEADHGVLRRLPAENSHDLLGHPPFATA